MRTIVEETEKLVDEIGNITSNGECLETEIWYSGANNYNMNTSYVYKLGDRYYSVSAGCWWGQILNRKLDFIGFLETHIIFGMGLFF